MTLLLVQVVIGLVTYSGIDNIESNCIKYTG